MPSRQPAAHAGATLERYCGAVAVVAGFFTAGLWCRRFGRCGLVAAAAPAFVIVM